jgi:feruloyl esterase
MGGGKATAKFARLFLVPGVNHGFRGPGAQPTGFNEALVFWVEEGKAPDKLLAEKRDAGGQVIRTRPLFPYPQAAKYKGSGSTDEEKNFRSKEPN